MAKGDKKKPSNNLPKGTPPQWKRGVRPPPGLNRHWSDNPDRPRARHQPGPPPGAPRGRPQKAPLRAPPGAHSRAQQRGGRKIPAVSNKKIERMDRARNLAIQHNAQRMRKVEKLELFKHDIGAARRDLKAFGQMVNKHSGCARCMKIVKASREDRPSRHGGEIQRVQRRLADARFDANTIKIDLGMSVKEIEQGDSDAMLSLRRLGTDIKKLEDRIVKQHKRHEKGIKFKAKMVKKRADIVKSKADVKVSRSKMTRRKGGVDKGAAKSAVKQFKMERNNPSNKKVEEKNKKRSPPPGRVRKGGALPPKSTPPGRVRKWGALPPSRSVLARLPSGGAASGGASRRKPPPGKKKPSGAASGGASRRRSPPGMAPSARAGATVGDAYDARSAASGGAASGGAQRRRSPPGLKTPSAAMVRAAKKRAAEKNKKKKKKK